jgi:hypothetical protein
MHMSAFFSNFLTGHPIKAVQSFYTSSDMMEIKKFLDLDYRLMYVKPAIGFTKRRIAKDVKRLYKGKKLHPAGIKLIQMPFCNEDHKDFAARLMDDNAELAWVTADAYDKIRSQESHVGMVGSLRYTPFYGFGSDEKVIRFLDRTLRKGWLTIQKREGTIPDVCSQCSEELYVDDDLTCVECDHDVEELGSEWKDTVEVFKDIQAYEKKTGKLVLERVA